MGTGLNFTGILTKKEKIVWKNGNGFTYKLVFGKESFTTFNREYFNNVEEGDEIEIIYTEKQNGQFINRNILSLRKKYEEKELEDLYQHFSGASLTRNDKFDEVVGTKKVTPEMLDKVVEEYKKVDEDYKGLSSIGQKKKRIIDNHLKDNFDLPKELDYLIWEVHAEFMVRARELDITKEDLIILGKAMK